MGQVRWTEKAATDLESIHDFISRDSLAYADRFVRSLIAATDRLSFMPMSGRVVPEASGYGFREIIYRNYRIVYRAADTPEEDVEILSVVHGARDMRKALDSELDA